MAALIQMFMKRYFIIIFTLIICSYTAIAQNLKVKLTEHTGNLETVAYSQDGRYLASAGWDGMLNLYAIDSFGFPRFKQAFSGHLGAVTSLWFSANGKLIVSCGKDYSARIWNIIYPDSSRIFNMHFEPVTTAFLDPGGKTLITSSTDGTIRNTSVYDAKKSKVIKVGKAISDILISKDNKFYYVAVKGSTIMKIETGSTKTVEEFVGHKDEVNALDLSPDGKFLASGSSDKTIIIWDLSTSKELKKLAGFEWKVTSVEFSLDGKYIIGGCNDGTVKLFDVETGKMISEFTELSKNVRDVTFSPDQTQIAVATNLESDKYGAVIYNSGVRYVKPQPVANSKGTKPADKNKQAPTRKATTKPTPAK